MRITIIDKVLRVIFLRTRKSGQSQKMTYPDILCMDSIP